MLSHASRALGAQFDDNVRHAREAFLRDIASLPPPLHQSALHAFEGRLSRALDRPMLGEFMPWLVADLLGISEVRPVQEVASAWLHVYLFTLMLDDFIDGRTPPRRRNTEMITASLMLQRGVTRLVLRASNPGEMEQVLNDAFGTTAAAAHRELAHHRNRIKAFSMSDVTAVGQKVALLRVCLRALEDLVPTRERGLLDYALSRLATGVQLLDDLTDWEEDLRGGNFTLPLTILKQRSPEMAGSADADRANLLAALLASTALEQTLRAALHALQDTLAELRAVRSEKPAAALVYLENLVASGRVALDVFARARSELRIDCGVADSGTRSHARTRQEVLKDVESQLAIVAQSS